MENDHSEKIFLLERDSPDISSSQGMILSLNPETSSGLKSRGEAYRIVEDFYEETRLLDDEQGYFDEQLKWFREFDRCLQEGYPFLKDNDLDLASAFHNRFVYLADSFVIKALIVDRILKKFKPSHVIGLPCGQREKLPPHLEDFLSYDRQSYLPFFAAAAEKYKAFRFEVRPVCPRVDQKRPPSNGPGYFARFPHLSYVLRRVRRYFRYEKFRALSCASKSWRDIPLFFPEIGAAALDAVYAGLCHTGSPIYTGDDLACFFRAVNFPAELSGGDRAWRLFESTSLLDWHNRYSPLDLRPFLKPYLEYFIKTTCPQMISKITGTIRFFERFGIQAVISRASVGEQYTVPLLAAKVLKLPRICFQHSVGPLDMKNWVFDELIPFDFNFAISTPSQRYFEEQSKRWGGGKCTVYESSHYLSALGRQCRAKRRRRGDRRRKPVLIYCPSKLAYGLRHFSTLIYPLTWYFEHQTLILDFLMRHAANSYRVIYKPSSNQSFINGAVLRWLKCQDLQGSVEVDFSPLSKVLPGADRILLDYPSTGLFESVVCKVPALCLCSPALKIWPGMLPVFGKILRRFSCPEEAFAHVRAFLSAPTPEEYLTEIPLSPLGPVEQIQKILCVPL
jgi:hypothetical protein